MKVTLSKDAFVTGLRRVLSVVSSRTTLPILNNVLLEATGQQLRLATTDLEVSIQTDIPATVQEDGKTTLPAKKLGQIASSLPEGDVTLETSEDEHTTISCQKSFFNLVGLSADEFPRENEVEESWQLKVPCDEFRRNLGKVFYAASVDETRQVLNGVLLSVRESVLTMAATDGRRLALVEKHLEGENVGEGDVILPPKAVSELQRSLARDGELDLHLSDARARFTFGNTVFVTKLVEGNYPNYRQVIPEGFSHSAVIPREQFSNVLNRVAMVVSENNATVRLELDNALMTVHADSSEIGEGSEPLEISYEGPATKMAFNPTFLSDPLKHLEADQLVMRLGDEVSPVSMSGDEGFLYVIMPMRG